MIADRVLNVNRLYQKKRPLSEVCLTFIDDDGSTAILSNIKPLCEKYKIPFTLAFVTTIQGLGISNSLFMQNNLKCEIASHSKSHKYYDRITEAEMIEEIVDSKTIFYGRSLFTNNFVYPGGISNEFSINLVSQNYNCGFKASGGVNFKPINRYNLSRIALGAYIPNGQLNTIEFYKSKIDEAIVGNGWLVFMTHVGDLASGHTETQQQYLEQTIQYALSRGVQIVNVQTGLNNFL